MKEEITRLTTVIESERRNAGSRTEIERLTTILIQRDSEIRTLNEQIYVLKNQAPVQNQSNEWQLRYNESQKVITQLNLKITSLTQQLAQYESQFSQMNTKITTLTQQLSQYESQTHQISQLNIKITSLTQQLSQYESQINQLNIHITQYKTEITQLNIQINEYKSRISQL